MMINAEKYQKELQEIRKGGYQIGRDRKTHELFKCEEDNYSKCDKCMFNVKNELCSNVLTDWLLEEAPKYKLTKFEYLFLKNLKNEYSYISRDVDDDIVLCQTDKDIVTSYLLFDEILKKPLFTFITQDKESYVIKDILDNCEVIDDE